MDITGIETGFSRGKDRFKTLFGLAGLAAHVGAAPAIIKLAIKTPLASFLKRLYSHSYWFLIFSSYF